VRSLSLPRASFDLEKEEEAETATTSKVAGRA